MWDKKGQYINLKDRPDSLTGSSQRTYRLFPPLIQLSGPRRGRSWKLSREIFIQKRKETDRSFLIDLTSIFRGIVYGISFLVFAIGRFFRDPNGRGQVNGGQV